MENKEDKAGSDPKQDTKASASKEETHDKAGDDLNGDEHHGEEAKDDKDNEHHDDEIQDLDETLHPDIQQTAEQDIRSVYVKSVDYSATKEEVTEFFKSCGKINRVTILTDKYTGNPKGYAYIEFVDKEGADNALLLSESTFKGRTITVNPKRTNTPNRGRGRGRRFVRGGGFYPMRRGYSMFSMRPMRRGFRPY